MAARGNTVSQRDLSQSSTFLDVCMEEKVFMIVGSLCLVSPSTVELKRLYPGERLFFLKRWTLCITEANFWRR